LVVRNIANDRRYLLQARHLRGAPAALAGDDLVTLRAAACGWQRTRDDRLHDTLRADRIREVFQRFLAHVDAWLVLPALQQVHGDAGQPVSLRRLYAVPIDSGAGIGSIGRDRYLGEVRLGPAQESVEAAAEALLFRHWSIPGCGVSSHE